jgi:hypothetical protein
MAEAGRGALWKAEGRLRPDPAKEEGGCRVSAETTAEGVGREGLTREAEADARRTGETPYHYFSFFSE